MSLMTWNIGFQNQIPYTWMHSRTRFGLLRMKENLSSHIIPLFLPVFFPALTSPIPPFFPQSLGWQKAKEVEGGRMGKRAQIGRQGFTERLKSVHECMKRTKEASQTSSTFPETMWSAHRSLTDTDIVTAGAGSWYFRSLFRSRPFVFVTICDYDCMSEWSCHSCHRIPQAGMTAQCSLWTLSPCWKTSLREVNVAQHLIVDKTMISYKLSVPMMSFSPPAT